MLHDLDLTLESLVRTEGKLNKSDIDVDFDQPTSEWSARLSRPTLNMFCYDVRENVKLRLMDRTVTRSGNRATTELPPRRVDLSYLVTAWARKIEDEHQLLWRSLVALKKHFSLAPVDCEGMLRLQSRDINLKVADMSDNPMNLIDLWSVLDNQMKLGFTVVATIELDTDISFEGPLVLEAEIRVGTSNPDANPRHPEILGEYGEIRHTGDRERFEETGEKHVETEYSVGRVEPKDEEEGGQANGE